MRPALIAAAVTLLTFAATAQDVAAQPGSQNPAIKSPDANNSPVPVKGANSFTADQAKSRIEARGYSNVAGIHKDGAGVWRATASKDGKNVSVSVDYQGNVN